MSINTVKNRLQFEEWTRSQEHTNDHMVSNYQTNDRNDRNNDFYQSSILKPLYYLNFSDSSVSAVSNNGDLFDTVINGTGGYQIKNKSGLRTPVFEKNTGECYLELTNPRFNLLEHKTRFILLSHNQNNVNVNNVIIEDIRGQNLFPQSIIYKDQSSITVDLQKNTSYLEFS